MFDITALWNRAKAAAKDTFSGGLQMSMKKTEEKFKELSVSTGTSALMSAASYGIGKIPLVGSEFSFLFDKAVSDPVQSLVKSKTLERLLEEAQSKGDITKILQYKNQQIESNFDDMLGQYVVMRRYFDQDFKNRPVPDSCDDAYKSAFEYCLAKTCISDLEKNIKALEEFIGILKPEIEKMKPAIKARKQLLMFRLTLWGEKHSGSANKRCNGLHGCFFRTQQFQQEKKKDLSANPNYLNEDDLF